MNKEQKAMALSEKRKASNYKWDRANMTIVGVRIRNTEKEEFRQACERNGTTMNAVLIETIRQYIKDHAE